MAIITNFQPVLLENCTITESDKSLSDKQEDKCGRVERNAVKWCEYTCEAEPGRGKFLSVTYQVISNSLSQIS